MEKMFFIKYTLKAKVCSRCYFLIDTLHKKNTNTVLLIF